MSDILQSRVIQQPVPVQRVSPRDGGHWFFGYFDKCPWDVSGRFLLALRCGFMDRPPQPDDTVTIHTIDTEQNNRATQIGQSNVFCWQQSNMLQWLPGDHSQHIIFNDRSESRFFSRILDTTTLESRRVDAPVYCLNPDGRRALSLNFARLNTLRPGYGYAGASDPWAHMDHPDDDGIYLVNLETNQTTLIISNASLLKNFHAPQYEGRTSWFNHLLWNPSGTRFAFLQRCANPDPSRTKNFTRFFTANADGSDIYLLNADEMTSHYTWQDDATIIAYAGRFGAGWHYFQFRDKTQTYELIGHDVFDADGHCSPDASGRWMLTDTYPREDNCRILMLYDRKEHIRYDLGRFHAPPEFAAPLRCDLHPRWSRDHRHICFDSLHEGFRGMYVVNVTDIVTDFAI